MTSLTMEQMCDKMGITQSFSRPRVSDDNPYSESQFKTMKYQPDYPARFESLYQCKRWLIEFFRWYNEEHNHSGLELFTPSEVYNKRVEEVAKKKQEALDKGYAQHPERVVKGPPVVRLPASEVSINPAPPMIPSKEPLPKASLCSSPAKTPGGRAEAQSRATKSARSAQPLKEPSTTASSRSRRTLPSAHCKGS